jgi:hypothetical protein
MGRRDYFSFLNGYNRARSEIEVLEVARNLLEKSCTVNSSN